jgi:hypothetical protein
MRRTALAFFFVFSVSILGGILGCDDNGPTTANPNDLAPPLGLESVTKDNSVILTWAASNYGEDRQGFQVYLASGTQSGTPEDIPSAFGSAPVEEIATTTNAGSFSVVVDSLVNGVTYSFLVVAYKDDGDKISRPSNIVTDTPRRESPGTITLINGTGNARYLDVAADPAMASTSSTGADILAQSFNAGAGDRAGMVGQNGARVQDLGYVANWDEIDQAPLGSGSYPDASYSVEVLPGHVYAVFTGDNHYAKIWIVSLNTSDFGYTVRVAYQPQVGNNELKPGLPGGQ